MDVRSQKTDVRLKTENVMMHRSSLAAYGIVVVVILSLMAGFAPGRDGKEIRRPFSEEFASMRAISTTRPLSHVHWNMRGACGNEPPETLLKTRQNRSRQPVLEVRNGTVHLRTVQGMAPVRLDSESVCLLPILPLEPVDASLDSAGVGEEAFRFDAGMLAIVDPLEALGEPLDFEGMPLRWNREIQSCDITPEAKERARQIIAALRELAGVSASVRRRAEQYSASVEQYASRYKLAPELVYALIYSESSFNPALISSRFAHGLMQVVPHTAGSEVNRWLGHEGNPETDTLLRPDTNIKYGTTYFHLLLTRHLQRIKNPVSREYCAIAAYNIGSETVLRTFAPNRMAAFNKINSLTPEDVRDTLLRRLPSGETRSFLNKVLGMRARFALMS